MAKKSLMTGLVKSIAAKKGKKIELDMGAGGGFSPNIEGGIAKITNIEIAKHKPGAKNAGKPYFGVRGVCVLPKEYEGEQDFLIMEPLYDNERKNRSTQDECVERMLSVLQSLGVDTDEVDPEDYESGELFETMLEEDLYCRFRTWKGEPTKEYPNPRTNVVFRGGCEAPVLEDDDEVVDEGEDEEEEEDEAPRRRKKKADVKAKAAAKKSTKKKAAKPEPEEEEEEDEEPADDLEALGEAADNGDEDAMERLETLAEKTGVDPDDYASWPLLAEYLSREEGGTEGDEEDDEEEETEEDDEEEGDEEEPSEPEKGMTVYYKPKGKRRFLEFEVRTLNKSARTVSLSGEEGSYRSVPFEDLHFDPQGKDIPF